MQFSQTVCPNYFWVRLETGLLQGKILGHWNKSNENFVNGLELHIIHNRHEIWCLCGSPEIKNKGQQISS